MPPAITYFLLNQLVYRNREIATQPRDNSLVLSTWQKLMPKRYPIDYAKTILRNAHFTDPFHYISKVNNNSITFSKESHTPSQTTQIIPLSQMEQSDYAMLVNTIASSKDLLRELEN